MKNKISTLILFCLSNMLFAQSPYDTIYAVVNGNSVTIHQDNAYQNCGFQPFLENVAFINDTTIEWYQTDTIGTIYGCGCFFDYSVTLDSLQPGHYLVNVFSVYDLPEGIYSTFEGTTSFIIEQQIECDSIIALTSYASLCHEYTGVSEKIINDDFHHYSVISDQTGISIISNDGRMIEKVVINDLSGRLVYQSTGNPTAVLKVALSRGFYLVSIFNSGGYRLTMKTMVN